ncbi:hypothetical protein K9B35_12530 [Sphingomonas sp. R647]|uniref:hypothetical protein n=1 Tax=Sphingomonas sp. R647 TaxID=2875233 RepID=UPI001CD2730E|nr:hypothetical protein [Sphingomonas sp. R647]MCA1198796.1 hypothetical protein [Sphingomonas sp. R647]
MSLRVSSVVGAALVCALLMLPRPAMAGPFDALPTEVRTTAEPLDLLVMVPQTGLRVQYSPTLSLAPVASFGGPVGMLFSGILERRERDGLRKKGRAFDPSLADFDAHALALTATRAAFAETVWLRAADARVATNGEAMARDLPAARATLTFEYAVNPSNTRVFVACALKVRGGDPVSGWQDSNLRYENQSEASIEWEGAPSKQARFTMLTANNGERLKRYLEEAFYSCARLTKRRAELSAEEIAEIRARPETTIVLKEGWLQIGGWLVDGPDGTVRGKFGPLGVRKTFTAPGTPGVLLLGYTGFFHNRVDPSPNR